MSTLIPKKREQQYHDFEHSIYVFKKGSNYSDTIQSIQDRITTCLIEHYEEDIRELEGKYKDEKVCAYCLDTKWMKVNNGRGNYKNQTCVWCIDGKEKLENDQIVHSGIEWNSALDLAISLLQDKIKQLKQ